jgi:hypothetical protein
MPLPVKSISVSIAVASLFMISCVGWLAGLEPFVCCKRSVIGAVIVYAGATIVVRLINDILINVLAKSQIEQQDRDRSERGN